MGGRVRYFLVTAETGQITRAAQRLCVSQPALTQSLHVLERQIGTPLFVRHRHGVDLTEAGQQFLLKALVLQH